MAPLLVCSVAGLVGNWHVGGAGAPETEGSAGVNDTFGAARLDFQVRADGHYKIRFSMPETAIFQAVDGKWTRSPQSGPAISGTYRFDGRDRVTMVTETGVTEWHRAD